MKDPGSFLLLAAGAATDIACRNNSKDLLEAFEYRAKGMVVINRRMMIPEQSISDGAITACSMLAGLEVANYYSVFALATANVWIRSCCGETLKRTTLTWMVFAKCLN